MEFQALLNFFTSLLYARRKYPQIVTYTNKYLHSLNDEKKYKEVEKFKHFLIINQQINNKVLDHVEFETGKPDIILMMQNFLGGTEKEAIFWSEIQKVEQLLFPFGKPAKLPECNSGITGALERFKDNPNPILSDILNNNAMENLEGIQDITELLNKPGFQEIVEKVTTNVTRGKYNIVDLARVVTDIIDSVKHDVDSETQNALTTVANAMQSLENHQQIDLQQLLNAAKKIKVTK